MKLGAAAIFLSIVCGCVDAPVQTPTQAVDARNVDPWLAGAQTCPDAGVPPDLKIEDVTVGTGPLIETNRTVRVHYAASIATDGTPKQVHDSHADGPPIELEVGSSTTMCGLDRALLGMHAGGQRRVVVPAALAFGERGHPPEIPPGTDLILVIDLFLPPGLGESKGSGGRPPQNPGGRGGGGGRRR